MQLKRVLALDPGFERLGIAVIEKEKGKEILVASDCIRTLASLPFPLRLNILGKTVEAWIEKYSPTACALEEIYFAKNEKTAMKIAEVRGMLTYLAMKNNLALSQYTPLQIKVAITGYGRGDKTAVAAMIPHLVSLPKLKNNQKMLDDELDAIAVGLTYFATTR